MKRIWTKEGRYKKLSSKYYQHLLSLPNTLNLIITAIDGIIRSVSDPVTGLLGYEPLEMVGKPYFTFIHPDDCQNTANEEANLAKGGVLKSFVNRWRHKDGHYLSFSWMAKQAADSDYVYWSATDITEQYQLQAMQACQQQQILALQQQIDIEHETQAMLEAQQALVAHKMRNPLNSMVHVLDGMAENIRVLQEQTREQLSVLENTLPEMQQLLKTHKPLQLETCVSELIAVYRPYLTSKNASISLTLSQLPNYLGDSHKIEIIMINLIVKAIQLTRKGTLKITAQDSLDSEGEHTLLMELHYNGAVASSLGATTLPSEGLVENNVATPSWSAISADHDLALTRRLVEEQKGQLFCATEPDGGGALLLQLPLSVAPALVKNEIKEKSIKKENQLPDDLPAMKAPRGIMILIVDDQPFNRKIMLKILTTIEGVTETNIVQATTGMEAISAVAEHYNQTGRCFDVIFMDVVMPKMNGNEAVEQIRRFEQKRRCQSRAHITMASSNGTELDKQKSYSVGADHFLTKPYVKHEIKAVIGKIVSSTVSPDKSAMPVDDKKVVPRRRHSYSGDEASAGRASLEFQQFFKPVLDARAIAFRPRLVPISEDATKDLLDKTMPILLRLGDYRVIEKLGKLMDIGDTVAVEKLCHIYLSPTQTVSSSSI